LPEHADRFPPLPGDHGACECTRDSLDDVCSITLMQPSLDRVFATYLAAVKMDDDGATFAVIPSWSLGYVAPS